MYRGVASDDRVTMSVRSACEVSVSNASYCIAHFDEKVFGLLELSSGLDFGSDVVGAPSSSLIGTNPLKIKSMGASSKVHICPSVRSTQILVELRHHNDEGYQNM